MDHPSDGLATLIGFAMLLILAVLITYVMSFLTGWRSLASQFKTTQPMPAGSFLIYQASFRYVLPYRYVLILGSSPEGLHLKFWPRIGHPTLMIPWAEIEIMKPTGFAIFKYQTLRLGRRQRVSFFLGAGYVSRLVQMAGVQASAPPPPPSPYAPAPLVEETDRRRVGLGPEYKG